jgi:hypothetical protein
MANMLRRIWSNLLDSFPLRPPGLFDQRFRLGSADFILPAGWRAVKRSEEVYIVRPVHEDQQATISLVRFESEPSFDAFKALCEKRLYFERRELADGDLESVPPSADGRTFSKFFSGVDIKNNRLFSGCILLAGTDLFTIYLEGSGMSSKQHLNSFVAILSCLKIK